MSHDFDTLFINEGKLQHFNQNRKTFEPYMSIEEVKVLSKTGSKSVTDPEGYAKYEFALNTAADSTWHGLFYQNVPLNRDALPRFVGTQMILTCDPANLESHYQKIRLSIQTTNAMYRTEKENVFRRVEQEMTKRQLSKKQEGEKEETIKRGFDELEL
jgi:hypothetical protein